MVRAAKALRGPALLHCSVMSGCYRSGHSGTGARPAPGTLPEQGARRPQPPSSLGPSGISRLRLGSGGSLCLQARKEPLDALPSQAPPKRRLPASQGADTLMGVGRRGQEIHPKENGFSLVFAISSVPVTRPMTLLWVPRGPSLTLHAALERAVFLSPPSLT